MPDRISRLRKRRTNVDLGTHPQKDYASAARQSLGFRISADAVGVLLHLIQRRLDVRDGTMETCDIGVRTRLVRNRTFSRGSDAWRAIFVAKTWP